MDTTTNPGTGRDKQLSTGDEGMSVQRRGGSLRRILELSKQIESISTVRRKDDSTEDSQNKQCPLVIKDISDGGRTIPSK